MQNALRALCCSHSAGFAAQRSFARESREENAQGCENSFFFFFFEIVSFVASAHQTPAVAESTGNPSAV